MSATTISMSLVFQWAQRARCVESLHDALRRGRVQAVAETYVTYYRPDPDTPWEQVRLEMDFELPKTFWRLALTSRGIAQPGDVIEAYSSAPSQHDISAHELMELNKKHHNAEEIEFRSDAMRIYFDNDQPFFEELRGYLRSATDVGPDDTSSLVDSDELSQKRRGPKPIEQERVVALMRADIERHGANYISSAKYATLCEMYKTSDYTVRKAIEKLGGELRADSDRNA